MGVDGCDETEVDVEERDVAGDMVREGVEMDAREGVVEVRDDVVDSRGIEREVREGVVLRGVDVEEGGGI